MPVSSIDLKVKSLMANSISKTIANNISIYEK